MSWPRLSLDSLCTKITDGSHNPPKGVSESSYLMLSSKNIFNNSINYDHPRYLSAESFDFENKRTEVEVGDVLLTIVGTIGRSAVVRTNEVKFALQRSVAVLKPNHDLIDSQYLMYWLQSITNLLNLNARGVAQKGIYLKQVRELEIPLPPLPIQKQIAAVLERADTLRSQCKQMEQELNQLAQSVFLEMFGDPIQNPMGWPKKPLSTLMDIRRGGSPRPIDKFIGGTFPWIKIGDATKGDELYITSTKQAIIEEGLSKTVYLPEGSLIFANCGVSLGFARILKIAGCIHDGWLSFSEIQEDVINKVFLLKSINSITQYFRDIAPDGTQPNLNTKIMKEFEIILPPINKQKEFEKIIYSINDRKKTAMESVVYYEKLFNSLLQRAFSGKLALTKAA